MQTKIRILFLTFTLVLVPLGQIAPAQARTKTDDDPAKIKANVEKRLANKKTKVEIKLRSGSKIKGRITQAGENGFTITEDKTGKQSDVSYSEVAQVRGRGMSTGTKIALIVGVAAVVVIVAGVISVKNADFFRGGIRVP
jgi:hypothetical protein